MSLWSRIRTVIRPESHQDEIREELDFHLEMDRMLGHEKREARLRLGNPTRIQEEVREMRSIPVLETLWRDVRFSVRSILGSPTLAATVVGTLAIGIGATTVIFSVVNGVLLKPLPYPQPDELVSLAHKMPNGISGSASFLYFTYAEHNRTFQSSGLWASGAGTITGRGDPEQVPRIGVTPEVLALLGVAPARGRLFTAADGQPGSPLRTVLTYGYWQRRFGGDDSVVGQSLIIDNQPFEIIGIMPRDFRFLDVQVDLFQPVQLDRSRVVQGNFAFNGIGRLKPGISLDQASADMARMIPIAIDSFPTPPGITKEQVHQQGMAPNPKSLKDAVLGNVGDTLWILMGTIGVVLLIACANVMNLFLVRTEGRQRELALRSALGASRLRIASGLLTEAVILGIAGGVLGFATAYAGLRLVVQNAPANLPRTAEIDMNGTVLAFASLLTVGACLFFGLAPALRHAAPGLRSTLHAGGRTMSPSREGRRTRAGLVILQVGLALILLIASGLMLRTYQALIHVDPGFRHPESLQLAHLSFARGPAFDVTRAAQNLRQIVDAAEAIPGVTSAAFVSSAPLENGSPTTTLFMEGFGTEGQLPAARLAKFISPQYFRTLGMPLLAGRDLEWVDHFDARAVTIVSESLAKEAWGAPQTALGKHVRTNPADPWREIVGVVGDAREVGMNQPVTPAVYFPFLVKSFWSNPSVFWSQGSLIVRTSSAGTEGLVQDMQRAVNSVDGRIPLSTPSTVGELYRRSMERTSFTLVMLSVAGLMALLLGIVGLYGTIAYTVAQRKREIGIRVALGGSLQSVRGMFVRQALVLVSIGTAIGLMAAFALTRLMDSLLFGVKAVDPATFLLMPALLAGIAILASYLPARRAVRVDAMEALREE